MRVKCILFELSLAVSAPLILAAALYSARETTVHPAAAYTEIGEGVRIQRERSTPVRGPELIARAFRAIPALAPGSVAPTAATNGAADRRETAPRGAPVENRLVSLGTIRDADNIERLYVKDTGTGGIRAVRTDGNIEDGNYIASALEGSYVINVDGVLYSIRRE
jgi:hypothetical protein